MARNPSNRYKSNRSILNDLKRFVRFLSRSDTAVLVAYGEKSFKSIQIKQIYFERFEKICQISVTKWHSLQGIYHFRNLDKNNVMRMERQSAIDGLPVRTVADYESERDGLWVRTWRTGSSHVTEKPFVSEIALQKLIFSGWIPSKYIRITITKMKTPLASIHSVRGHPARDAACGILHNTACRS